MKIGFWQLERGHGCSTSNMIAIATYLGLTTKVKSVMLQSHFDSNNLMQSFYVNKKKGSTESIGEPGIDELVRLITSKKTETSGITATTYSFLSGKLSILYETFKSNKNLYYNDFMSNYSAIINAFNTTCDLTFIDIEGGHSGLSKILRDSCDYVVYSISQEKTLLDKLFSEEEIDYTKAIFIIGDYDSRKHLTYKNIMRSYPALGNRNLFIIPNCAQFANAMNSTSVIRFFDSLVTDDTVKMKKSKNVKRFANSDDLDGFLGNIDQIAQAILGLTGLK